MKKTSIALVALLFIALTLAACGWKPEVTPVPITAPWAGMNLPVKENAVVWGSTPTEFKAVHKDDKKTVTKNYTEALKAQGWTLGKFDTESSGAYVADMTKTGETISVRIYDFNNTGVIIEKK
ncbi:MAG: hypothetical protein ABL959_00370 [Pyrinomonadaceae bacterium]